MMNCWMPIGAFFQSASSRSILVCCLQIDFSLCSCPSLVIHAPARRSISCFPVSFRPRASDGRHDTRAGNRSGPVTLEMTAELFTEDIHRLYVETKTIAPAPLPTFDPFDYPCAAPSGSVSAEMDDSGDSTSLDSVTEGIAPSHAFNSKSCRSELLEERRYYVTTPSTRGEHEDVHLTSDSDQESPHSFTDMPILPPKSTPTRTPTTDTAPGSKLQDMMDEQLLPRVEKETSAPAPAPAPAPAQAQTESEKKDLSKLPSWRKRYFA